MKFGTPFDDWDLKYVKMLYVGPDGKLEKSIRLMNWQINAIGRVKVPPLGVIPGHEDYQWRHIASFQEPREMLGVGQLTIRARAGRPGDYPG